MSELLDDGELPSGYFFAGPTATPVGGNTGILPANGEVVSLATYPGLTWMNTNIGFLPGPVFTTLFGAPGFNVLQSSGPGGEMLYNYSSVIGPYYILCGSNNVPNSTIGIGASVCISSDLQNWSISQINTVVGSICVGIVKAGATYYATVQGTNAQSYIYSSTNLTSWAIAFTFTGGTAVDGVSQMIATGSIVASLQGGTTNISFYNGVTWYTDTNNIGANNYLSNFNTLSTGEIGGIALTSSGSNGIYSFSAWKFGVGATVTTISQVDPGFTGSVLCPSANGLFSSSPANPFNAKLSYVGGNYVATIGGVIYTSPDFAHWTKQGDKQFIAIENVGGTMYAISVNSNNLNQYFSSQDGINWTLYYTSPMNQGYLAGNCGARILPMSGNAWAVCSSVFDQYMFHLGGVYGQQGSWVSFVFNPTGTPLVMQSTDGAASSVCTFSVDPAGTGIFAGNCSLVPAYNPTLSALMPNLTSPYGAGTEMFMKI